MYITQKAFLTKLVERGVLTSVDAERIEIDSLHQSLPIYEYLLKQGIVKKDEVLRIQAEFFQVPFVDISITPTDPQALNFVSEAVARRYSIIPYAYDPKVETI